MKKIKLLLFSICVMFFPMIVMAASGSIYVSGPNTAAVGNIITVTVKLTTGASWEMDLKYDRSFLQLTSSTADNGGTYMVNTSQGKPNRTYTFKFKTLKSGTTNVSVGSYYVVADDFSTVSISAGSKAIRIQTQAEIEASYSDDATLRSLSVDDHEISPEFNAKTMEYSLEVENDVEKVNVKAIKNNANASVKGDGEITLEEGTNKVEIIVTSQKGNSLTYVLNITRKELNPIQVSLNGKTYKLVRKADDLPNYSTFEATTVEYQGEKIPALHSDSTNLTLVGLKNDKDEIITFTFDNGSIKEAYFEVASNSVNLHLKNIDSVPYSDFHKTTIKFKGEDIEVFQYKNLDRYYIVYATDLDTSKDGYYLYDSEKNTFQVFDEDLFNALKNDSQFYLMMLCGALCLIFICIIIIISLSRRGKKKAPNNQESNQERVVEKVDKKAIKRELKERKKEEKEKKREKNQDEEEEYYNILEDE